MAGSCCCAACCDRLRRVCLFHRVWDCACHNSNACPSSLAISCLFNPNPRARAAVLHAVLQMSLQPQITRPTAQVGVLRKLLLILLKLFGEDAHAHIASAQSMPVTASATVCWLHRGMRMHLCARACALPRQARTLCFLVAAAQAVHACCHRLKLPFVSSVGCWCCCQGLPLTRCGAGQSRAADHTACAVSTVPSNQASSQKRTRPLHQFL